MSGWDHCEKLIEQEIIQLIEEGADADSARAAGARARERLEHHASEREIWQPFADVARRNDYPFVEPNDLAAIQVARIAARPEFSLSMDDSTLLDKLHGAWIGRCAGCALGKPVELFMGAKDALASWQRIKTYLAAISPGEWPLCDYIPEHSPAETITGTTACRASTREHIEFMETDDDIRYTVLGQKVLYECGCDFTSADVAHGWFAHLPYNMVCTAETQAYRNMVISADDLRHSLSRQRSKEMDHATDWHWIAHHMNPYREWIGAQIRIDSYGYATPGNPELAAEFAWRDARISHVKNGIYGAMFCAAMIATAFATNDVRTIIESGLAQIPQQSRLHHEMRQVIAICEKHGCRFDAFEKVITEIYSLLGHYHPVHTNNNAALCVMALMLSGGDYHRGITLAVMGGWDSDCNGATVGSILGAMIGAKQLPIHWTGRLCDTLNSAIPGYHPIAISECARRSLEIARQCKK